MGRKCSCDSFEEINEFKSPNEIEILRRTIRQDINFGNLEELKYRPHFLKDKNLSGDWYRCARCGDVWRLLEPSNASKGSWKIIDI
jgi:hypothetical protein